MSPRQLRAVAVGLAALLLVWLTTELLSKRSDRLTGSLGLPPVTEAGADRVAITHGADTIVLVKTGASGWTVNGYAASPQAVTDVFAALRDSTPPELAAQNPSSFARLGVDSAGGRWIRVTGGGRTLVELISGANGPTFGTVYVRKPGETRVYLWRGRALPGTTRVDDWRDKRVAAVEPDSVGAVEIARGKERYTLERGERTWTVTGRGPADSAAVAQLLDRYRNLTAVGFATPRQADSLKALHPYRRATLRGPGGRGEGGAQRRVLVALAFDSAASGTWVYRTDVPAPTWYRIDAWTVDQLTPAGQTLVRKK